MRRRLAVAAPVGLLAGALFVTATFMFSGPPGMDGGQSLTSGTACSANTQDLDQAAVTTLAFNAGWRGDDLAVAVAVAKAESGWSASATNENTDGSTDFGLFQINSIHAEILAGGDWSSAVDNAKMAYTVWQQAGGSFSPWVTYWDGTYEKFLTPVSVKSCAPTDPGNGPQGTDGLVPRAENIKAMITAQWGITDIGGYSWRVIAGTGTLSDHATGHAVDAMLGSDWASPAKKAEGHDISRYFASNAAALGIKYVIYYDEINTGNGWRPYSHPSCPAPCADDNLAHRNHVHVSVN